MNGNRPLVSMCVSAYNAEATLARTLLTIVSQTYSPVEIIVCDNASTDRTTAVIQQFSSKYPIRYLRNEKLIKAEENWNRLAGLAKGELVCIYHADDLYDPRIVEKCVEVFEAHERVGVVFTMARVIDDHDQQTGSYHLPVEFGKSSRAVYAFDDIFGALLKYSNSFLICPSAMFRKKAFEEFHGWDYVQYRSAADLKFLLRIAEKYSVSIIDEPLVSYRVSPARGSHKVINNREDPWDYFLVMKDYEALIKTHRHRPYFVLSQIKDLTIRALNFSATEHPAESMALIRQGMALYFKDWGKFVFSVVASGCFLIQIGTVVVNILPFPFLRKFYKAIVWNFVSLKKRLISY